MEINNEGDGRLDKPAQWGKKPTKQTSVNVKWDLWQLAKQNLIQFNDALEFGLLFLLADKDPLTFEYPNCNLLNKRDKFRQLFEAKAQECEALRDQLNNKDIIPQKTAKQEVDEIFNDIKGEVQDE